MKKNIKWTYEKLKESANRFKSVKEWRTAESSAYATACQRKILKELTKDMHQISPKGFWTKERVKKSARKYSHKRDWIKSEEGAYRMALKKDWLDEVCEHMISLGNKIYRLVYTIEVKGSRTVYVGLTGDFERRKRDHKKAKIYLKLAEKFGRNNVSIKKKTKYIHFIKAQNKEKQLINFYKNKKFNVLNIQKGGGLGGIVKNWTKSKIIETAKNFTFLKDFREQEPDAYNASLKSGFHKEIILHMKKKLEVNKWNESTIKKNALKFKTKVSWKAKYPGAVLASRKLGIYKLVTQHMKVLSPRNKWNKKEVIKSARNYKVLKHWRKNFEGAFDAAYRNGYLEEIKKNMIDGRKVKKVKKTQMT